MRRPYITTRHWIIVWIASLTARGPQSVVGMPTILELLKDSGPSRLLPTDHSRLLLVSQVWNSCSEPRVASSRTDDRRESAATSACISL